MDDAPEGWTVQGTKLHRTFEFADFAAAFAFMTRVAAVAEEREHHPDWSNSWNTVEVDLTSHDVGRITDRDVAMAEAIDGCVDA